MAQPYPLRGQIYLIKAIRNLGDTKKRPAVVVSINLRNELSQIVLVVPFTSDIRSGETPTRILLTAGEGGLETDSLATCDHVLAVRKTYLEQGPTAASAPYHCGAFSREFKSPSASILAALS
ncbi:type II toxin-antitoxin system PemK/MazF family toxin [Phormidium tenue]|uniref:type II toxin-antitoxin system PemK/MazF family toxin n=1 Tax=Phormidium tenue TaxID=126344 RepID=UPI001F55A1CB|nr:type II toxin-antitoxin system PemK/MazF family toxin [Phormidium tenue]